MELEYLERLLDAKFAHLETKIDNIQATGEATLEQAMKTNGRVTKLEQWRDETNGYWRGINKVVITGIAVFSIIAGAVATYFWH
jgi:hypothetical protein